EIASAIKLSEAGVMASAISSTSTFSSGPAPAGGVKAAMRMKHRNKKERKWEALSICMFIDPFSRLTFLLTILVFIPLSFRQWPVRELRYSRFQQSGTAV